MKAVLATLLTRFELLELPGAPAPQPSLHVTLRPSPAAASPPAPGLIDSNPSHGSRKLSVEAFERKLSVEAFERKLSVENKKKNKNKENKKKRKK